jgi:hypothetical protein
MQRLARLTVLLIALLAALLVVVVGSMLAGRYYYGSLAQSPSPSVPAGSSASGMSPEPTEHSSSASGMPTEETTALEETTAFQAPEGTPTSSTARIVCLRQEEGASPPPNNMEALNRGVLTRVLTPTVAAHPDGVHYRIDNRLGKATTYTSDPSRQPFVEFRIPKGVSHHAELFPPGLSEFVCDPTGDFNAYEATRAEFKIVEGDSGYKSLELECKPGMEGRFVGTMASGAGGSKFELVSYRDPVEEAREYFKEGLEEGDVVEAAGYPEDPNPTVRVVRNGRVIATVEFGSMNMYATYCEGDI